MAKVNVPETGVGFRGGFDAAPLAALLADTDYRAVRGDVLPDFEREQFADSDSRSGQKSGDHPINGTLALGENGLDFFRLQGGSEPIRTAFRSALQSIALANGLRRGPSLWSQVGQHTIASLPLAPHTAYRRSELQAMYEKFEAEIEKLNQRVEEQACKRPGARLLMTHPGVGPITALATEVFLGDPARFADSKALASYVGMIPREYSSGGRQRLGGLSKQGNPLLRFLWGEAGAHAARKDPELQRFYRRKLVQKGLGKASVAVARKLGIRLWIMLRDQIEYNEFCRRGQKQQKSSDACAGMPETRNGAKSHRPVD
jgi:hypothetical protein